MPGASGHRGFFHDWSTVAVHVISEGVVVVAPNYPESPLPHPVNGLPWLGAIIHQISQAQEHVIGFVHSLKSGQVGMDIGDNHDPHQPLRPLIRIPLSYAYNEQ